MPAGTIALTNNSATVTGTGTSFTTESKVNDFLVSTVGGLAYTLGVKSIESNTSLTLMEKYTGPSATGQSWTPVPYGTMAAITAQLASQVTYAIRGFNLDKANWQQIFTGNGTVTVTLPDGTSWQGPAWGGIASTLNSKANTSDVLLKTDNLASLQNKVASMSNLGYTVTRSSNNIVRKSKDSAGIDLFEMDFLVGATTAVGAFNAQVVGGITYYTHFYKFNLPQQMPNGILVALATLVGDRFGNQNPGYNADIKVSRDNDNGSGLLTSYLTISVKTPQTGWFPYFNIRVVGY